MLVFGMEEKDGFEGATRWFYVCSCLSGILDLQFTKVQGRTHPPRPMKAMAYIVATSVISYRTFTGRVIAAPMLFAAFSSTGIIFATAMSALS